MKLVIINGPCGVGKSTVSEIIHKKLPMSLLLDIDSQRRLYAGYREKPEQSTPLAQATALAMAGVALKAGSDVTVDKMQYIAQWYNQWINLGHEMGADTYEIILWASREKVLERADERGYGTSLTREKVKEFWEKINEFRQIRPDSIEINAEEVSTEEIVDQILAKINS